jgi:RHS repeat-associated protein
MLTSLSARAHEKVPKFLTTPLSCARPRMRTAEITRAMLAVLIAASPALAQRVAATISTTPHNGDNRDVAMCVAGCFDGRTGYSTPAHWSLDAPRATTLFYSSALARPMGMVEVDATNNSSPAPDKMSIRLRRPDLTFVTFTSGTTEIFYQGGSGTSRLAAQFDASTLATGAYDYTVLIRSHWNSDGLVLESSASTRVLVVKETTSPYGSGWRLAGIQNVVILTNGNLMLVDGDGSARHFEDGNVCGDQETCAFISPAGDFTTLTQIRRLDRFGNPTTILRFERRYPEGTLATFNSVGRLTSVDDRFNNQTSFTYHASGGVSGITDPAGKVITLTYDASNKLSSILDPGSPGRTTVVTVNGSGDLTHLVDPDGPYALVLTYDASHRLKTRTDRNSGVWGFAYDFADKLAADTAPTIYADGALLRPVVNHSSHEKAVLVDPSSGYGSSGNPATRVIPTNVRASITDARGSVAKYALDRWRAPTRIEEPYSRVTQITRNSNGRVTQTTSPAGQIVDYTWSAGNLTQVYDNTTGKTVQMSYELDYNQITQIRGHADSVWNYWSNGRLDSVRVGNINKKVTKIKYDIKGRDTLVTDPEGHETRKYYATSGWKNIDSVKVATRRTAFTYDAYGRIATTKDPSNLITSNEYDQMNRVTRTIGPSPLSDTTLYTYADVFLKAVTDAKGQRYAFARNVLGWVVSDTFPVPAGVTAVRTYAFDKGGNVTSAVNRRGQTISFTYDSLSNPLSQTADGVTTNLKIDPLGLFVASSNSVSTDTLKVDAAGRPTSEISIRGSTRHEWLSTYNVRDLRTMLRIVSPWADTIRYAYTAAMELDTLVDIEGGSTRFTYDSHRVPLQVTLPNGTTISYTFPSVHTRGKVTYSSPGPNYTLGVMYGFNGNGLVKDRVAVTLDEGVEFVYDVLRLSIARNFTMDPSNKCQDLPEGTSCSLAHKTYGASSTYTYDKVGNRTDLSAVVAWGNRLVKFNGDSLVYDADGNLNKRIRSGSEIQRLYWNSLGELVAVWTSGADSVNFAYDGSGRRALKWTSTATSRYHYDRDNLLVELNGAGNFVAEYTYYPGVDRPHSVRRGGTMYYFGSDDIGTVKGLFDGSANVVSSYVYDAWGTLTSSVETVANPIRFGGREYDSETGLYYNRARYYDPALGRFISEDPIGLGGGINPYAYAGNDPVNAKDPFGLAKCDDEQLKKGYVTKEFTREDGTKSYWCEPPGGVSLPPINVTARGPDPRWQPFGPGYFGPLGPPTSPAGPGIIPGLPPNEFEIRVLYDKALQGCPKVYSGTWVSIPKVRTYTWSLKRISSPLRALFFGTAEYQGAMTLWMPDNYGIYSETRTVGGTAKCSLGAGTFNESNVVYP